MVKKRQLIKFGILRFLPGSTGERYNRKYKSRLAPRAFKAALDDCKGMFSIDLGANVGEYSRMMALHSRRVVAFEPDPWTVDRLRENTKDLDNVEVVAAAAGLEDSEVMLYRHSTFSEDPTLFSQSSSVVSSKVNVAAEDAYAVRQIDFPRYLNETGEQIGVLKIDIEGAEVDLLEALFSDPQLGQKIKYIFCETHERKIPEHQSRVQKLRKAAHYMSAPRVNLFWR